MARLYDIQALSFEYAMGNQSVHALVDIDLQVSTGDFICLAGPSGSGKSTLLSVMGLIESVQRGTVQFLGKNLESLTEAEKNRIRKFHLGFIFQQFHLIPVLSAEENVEYFVSRQGLSRVERREQVRAALEAVGLWDLRSQRPNELSGGQRQRVAIARAIAKRPDVIIADEPTASLDQETARNIMEIIQALNRRKSVTVIAASHDPMVIAMAKTLIRLRDGRVSPEDG